MFEEVEYIQPGMINPDSLISYSNVIDGSYPWLVLSYYPVSKGFIFNFKGRWSVFSHNGFKVLHIFDRDKKLTRAIAIDERDENNVPKVIDTTVIIEDGECYICAFMPSNYSGLEFTCKIDLSIYNELITNNRANIFDVNDILEINNAEIEYENLNLLMDDEYIYNTNLAKFQKINQTNWASSGFVEVDLSQYNYYITSRFYEWIGVAAFDAEYNFIIKIANGNDIATPNKFKLNLPTNTKYISAGTSNKTNYEFAIYRSNKYNFTNAIERIDASIKQLEDSINTPVNNYYNNLSYEFPDTIIFNDLSLISTSSQYVSYENDLLIINYPNSSGNALVNIIETANNANYNYLKISITVDSIERLDENNGYLRLFTYTHKHDSETYIYTKRYEYKDSGTFEYTLDFQYMEVYEDIDTSYIRILISTLNALKVEISDIQIEWVSNNTDNNLYNGTLPDSLAYLNTKINAVQSSVATINSSKYFIGSNGDKYVTQINSNTNSLIAIPVIPRKSLFIGNSLIYGFGTYGMAASESSKCYYELVKSYILSQNPNAIVDKLYGSPFEHGETSEAHDDFFNNELLPMLSNDLDLISIQAVDNVNNDAKKALFPEDSIRYAKFIREHAPNARVIWVAGWYNHSYVPYVINACNKTGTEFVDIRPYFTAEGQNKLGGVYVYGTAARTYTIEVNSYTNNSSNNTVTFNITQNGNTFDVEDFPYESISITDNTLVITTYYNYINSTGVATHPGDLGHKNIANKILYATGMVDVENYYN